MTDTGALRVPDMNRACVIFNPRAGRHRPDHYEARIATVAQDHGWEVEVRSTTHAGEEVDLAAAARREGWPVVIAAGGDGTNHGVANGLLADGPTDTALGLLPLGTGNDFARSFGMRPGPLERNLPKVLRSTVRRVDLGRTMGEFFLNTAGLGFDAEVVKQTFRIRGLTGKALYLAAIYKAFASFVPPWIEVESEEHKERTRAMLFLAGNGRFAGGGLKLTPDADPADGMLDALIIRKVGWTQLLLYVPKVARGTHGALDVVALYRTRRITVRSHSGPLTAQLDGELRHVEREMHIEILPSHLGVLCEG